MKDIENVNNYERRQLHELLDKMLDEGNGTGMLSVAYEPHFEDFDVTLGGDYTVREYRILLTRKDRNISVK